MVVELCHLCSLRPLLFLLFCAAFFLPLALLSPLFFLPPVSFIHTPVHALHLAHQHNCSRLTNRRRRAILLLNQFYNSTRDGRPVLVFIGRVLRLTCSKPTGRLCHGALNDVIARRLCHGAMSDAIIHGWRRPFLSDGRDARWSCSTSCCWRRLHIDVSAGIR